MKTNRETFGVAAAALVLVASSGWATAATIPVTGWAVHNGTSVAGGTTADPTFAPGDNLTLMAPFSAVTLANDGDFIEATTTLTLNDRTANTGGNALNTQLRIGLFNGPAGAVVASDIPNVGFIIEYSNVAAGGLIREQSDANQTNPFVNPANIGNGVQDAGADSIQGANPGPVTFTLRLTRDADKIDLSGSIAATDSVSGNPYLATYTVPDRVPSDASFTFDRIGLFIGGNADATSAGLANSSITIVPEPTSVVLLGLAVSGALARRAPRRAGSGMKTLVAAR